jgi:hypothetical protein
VKNGKTSEIKTLGQRVAVYRVKRLGIGGFVLIALPGILGVLAPLLYGNYRYNFGLSGHGLAAAQAWSRPWYTLTWVALLAFAYLVIARFLSSRRYVVVFTRGIELRLNPLRSRKYRWNQIAGISAYLERRQFLWRKGKARLKVKLFRITGHPIQLPGDLENMPEFAARVKQLLYSHLSPSLELAYENGECVCFGPLTISSKGIRSGNTRRVQKSSAKHAFIPWEAVNQISLSEGYFIVEYKGSTYATKPARYPVSKIPNLEILFHIVQQGVST